MAEDQLTGAPVVNVGSTGLPARQSRFSIYHCLTRNCQSDGGQSGMTVLQVRYYEIRHHRPHVFHQQRIRHAVP